MSYRCWTTNGYGICTDYVCATEDGIRELLAMSPEAEKSYKYCMEKDGVNWNDATLFDFMMLDIDNGNLGLATIIGKVFSEVANIHMTACDDFDSKHYLVFEPRYPWAMATDERTISEATIDKYFVEFISILTENKMSDKEIKKLINYYDVPNGG